MGAHRSRTLDTSRFGLLTEDVIIENPDGTFSVDPTIYQDSNNWLRTATDENWSEDGDYARIGQSADLLGGAGEEYVRSAETESEEVDYSSLIGSIFGDESASEQLTNYILGVFEERIGPTR